MSVTASSPAPVAAQKATPSYVQKPNQDDKTKTLEEIEAKMEKIRPRLVRQSISFDLVHHWVLINKREKDYQGCGSSWKHGETDQERHSLITRNPRSIS